MDFNNFKPCFLIAMPELSDPFFKKTVVLLTDYNETGASGFIINRQTDVDLGSAIVLNDTTLNPSYKKTSLWFGGPVEQEKIWLIYDGIAHKDKNDGCVGDSICIARNIDILTDHSFSIDSNKIKIVHGFSGWSKGQLDNEITLSFWITAPLSRKLLFKTPTDKIWEQGIKNLGFDPSMLMGPDSNFVN